MSRAPVSGNNTIGSNAVTAIGAASVTHQSAIHNVAHKTEYAGAVIPAGGFSCCKQKNNRGPSIRKIPFLIFIYCTI